MNSTPLQNIDRDSITPELIAKMREAGMHDYAKQLEDMLIDPKDLAFESFITQHPNMLKLKRMAKKIVDFNDPVLIIGETGTGKELIAKGLHEGSKRKGRFISVNCAGFPESLIESILFGHKKGAFTGANEDKVGLMEAANEGTIFFDEVGELPKMMQAKLLRVIQEMRIMRIGSDKEIVINCRIVSATNRLLHEDILVDDPDSSKGFRSDLFFRISTFVLKTEPLRLRMKDVPLLVEALDKEKRIHNIEEFCSKIRPDHLIGNVRSLQQLIKRYYAWGEFPV